MNFKASDSEHEINSQNPLNLGPFTGPQSWPCTYILAQCKEDAAGNKQAKYIKFLCYNIFGYLFYTLFNGHTQNYLNKLARSMEEQKIIQRGKEGKQHQTGKCPGLKAQNHRSIE